MDKSICFASALKTALALVHTLRPLKEPKPEIPSVSAFHFVVLEVSWTDIIFLRY